MMVLCRASQSVQHAHISLHISKCMCHTRAKILPPQMGHLSSTCLCTCLRSCLHMHVCTNMSAPSCVRTCLHMHVWTNISTRSHLRTRLHSLLHKCLCAFPQTFIYTCPYTYLYTCLCACPQACLYTCLYTQAMYKDRTTGHWLPKSMRPVLRVD